MVQQHKISVLLVDDRQEKLLALEAILSEMPLELVRATSGREALRWLLKREFALILLDIDMPGLDGFETASLIRQRQASRDTPIIFTTAYQDELLMARGYSLGAVDYILQPVVPEILKSKVAVFVDLFRKTEQVRRQVQWQEQRAAQLRKLAAAGIAIHAAPALDDALGIITESAREVALSLQAATLFLREGDHASKRHIVAFSSSVAGAPPRHITQDADGVDAFPSPAGPEPARLSAEQIRARPDYRILENLGIDPPHTVTAVPLIGRGGQYMGVIYLADRGDAELTEDDKSILLQLAQMSVVAIENILNVEARHANRAKDQFIAVLSHELRTPLTPALSSLAFLVQDGRLPEDIRDDLMLVQRNVELEARLIDDLLDLTRIVRGKIEMHMVAVDVHDILRRALGICQTDILTKDLHVTIRLAAEKHFVKADPTRLQQVFWNILKNAVKFTPANGTIQVTSSNEPDGFVHVSIQDSGIGISADVLPKIFAAFEQGKPAITRQFGGLGLGLAISKALIDPHNGTLSAESEGSGQGSTFNLTLPLTQEAPDRAQDTPGDITPRHQLPCLRVLMVEDHRDTARVIARLLRSESLKVEWAPTVTEALHLASESHFDILVSDIGLPDGSGLDLMRQLKARQPIIGIALSGFGMEDDIRRSHEAGFAVHLTKPINFNNLIDRIRDLTLHVQPAAPARS